MGRPRIWDKLENTIFPRGQTWQLLGVPTSQRTQLQRAGRGICPFPSAIVVFKIAYILGNTESDLPCLVGHLGSFRNCLHSRKSCRMQNGIINHIHIGFWRVSAENLLNFNVFIVIPEGFCSRKIMRF